MYTKNTRVTYRYRDAGNCEQAHSIIVVGELAWKDIVQYLDEGVYFIPSQVGLEDLQPHFRGGLTGSDHVWHQLRESDIELVDDAQTVPITAGELLERLRMALWDEIAAAEALGLPAFAGARSGSVFWHPALVLAPALRAAMRHMAFLTEEAMRIDEHINRLYDYVSRDDQVLEQMIAVARVRCLAVTQHADEARQYLAFLLKELSGAQEQASTPVETPEDQAP